MYRFALLVVNRRIHGDEHWQRKIFLWFDDGDRRFGRKVLPVTVDLHNVFESSDRPVRTELGIFAVMHRGLVSQSVEERHFFVFNPDASLGDVNVFDGQFLRIEIRHIQGRCFTH